MSGNLPLDKAHALQVLIAALLPEHEILLLIDGDEGTRLFNHAGAELPLGHWEELRDRLEATYAATAAAREAR